MKFSTSDSTPLKATRLLSDVETPGQAGGLSVLFTILCIVDLFGVFPLVALPRAVIACGLYSIPLLVVVLGLQVYTAVLLGRCWVLARVLQPQIGEKSRYPYAAVAELACGARTRRLVTLLLDATVFGAGIPNLLVASQNLQLFWWKMSYGTVDISYCLWLLVIGLLLCPVMWLGSPKDMKTLAVVSVCIVTSVAACIWACILTDTESPPPAPASPFTTYEPAARDFFLAYGIIAFQFDIHPMLLTIQVDMKDSRRINTAVIGGFLVTGAMFSVTTALAAARYGLNVRSNILEGIPASVPLYVVSLLVTLQLCLSSAVGNSALFQHIEDVLKISRDFSLSRCVLRSSIVAVAVFLGEAVPRFDLVMGLVGSTLTGPLIFIFPPLFFIKLSRMMNTPEFKASQAEIQFKDSLSHNRVSNKHDSDICTQDGEICTQDGEIRTQDGEICTQDGEICTQDGEIRTQDGEICTQDGETRTQDGDMHKQNGQLPNLSLLRRQFPNYKTFGQESKDGSNWPKCSSLDLVLSGAVMLFGVTATLTATYSSWSDTIRYAKFTPPCLINATAAARAYIES